MTTREIAHVIKAVHIMDAASQTATFTSAAIDTQGWESLMVVWDMGVWVSGTWTLGLTECATVGGTYTVVPDANLEYFGFDANGKMNRLGAGAANAPIVSSLATDQAVFAVSYVGGTQRFVKAVATGATTPSGTFALVALQGFPRETVGLV